MKKIISLIVVLLITMVGISAMEEIDVNCHEGWFNGRICQDYELQEEFDEIVDGINDVETKITVVAARPDKVGGGGIGIFTVAEYLGWPVPSKEFNFLSFLKLIFMPKNEVNERMDLLQAQINLLEGKREINADSLSMELANVKKIREDHQGQYLCYFDRPCVFIG